MAARSTFCRFLSAVTIGLSVPASQACDVTIKDGDVSFAQLQGHATQEWNRHYPLEAGGTLSITNLNGPVEVTAGGTGGADIAAVLSARAMTDSRAKELLGTARIEEKVTPDRVDLTTTREGGGGGLSVSYKVTVPSDTRVQLTVNNGKVKATGLRRHLKAMVVNGGVELIEMSGSVDVASVNGAVSAAMAEVTAPIRLEGNNGRITLELPRTSRATLNARSINGGIEVNGLTVPEVSGRRIRNLETVLNGGGPEIALRITNGRITITGK